VGEAAARQTHRACWVAAGRPGRSKPHARSQCAQARTALKAPRLAPKIQEHKAGGALHERREPLRRRRRLITLRSGQPRAACRAAARRRERAREAARRAARARHSLWRRHRWQAGGGAGRLGAGRAAVGERAGGGGALVYHLLSKLGHLSGRPRQFH
jgi:hypothetical protein